MMIDAGLKGEAIMDLKKIGHTQSVRGEKDPWQRVASAIVIQTVKDFRNYARMLQKLNWKKQRDKQLTQEELEYLGRRILNYQIKLYEARKFILSEDFYLYSNLNGRALLQKLEAELR